METTEFTLVKYDAARQALAEAHRVDEAKDMRTKAMMWEAYAYQAKDNALLQFAREIKLRAERRAGELLREMEKTGQRQRRGVSDRKKVISITNDITPAPTLKDLGITKDQSSEWQKLANLPAQEFEQCITDARARPARQPRVTVKRSKPQPETPKPKMTTRDHCPTCNGPWSLTKPHTRAGKKTRGTRYCPACRGQRGVMRQAKARAERDTAAEAAQAAHRAALPRWARRLIEGVHDDQLIHQLIVEEWIIMTHIADLVKAQQGEREAQASLRSSALQLQGKYGGVVQIKDTLKLLDCLTWLGADLRDGKDVGNVLKKPWIAKHWMQEPS